MPKLHAKFYWSPALHLSYSIPKGKGLILFEYDKECKDALTKYMLRLNDFQGKKLAELEAEGKPTNPADYLRPLDVVIEYHYKKRTLDQNALMWALYEIEANEMNGGQSGAKEQLITAMDRYKDDLKEYGERETITTTRKHLTAYWEEWRHVEFVATDDGKQYPIKAFLRLCLPDEAPISICVIRGSSKFNTREMAQWIDRIFNRLAYHGVSFESENSIKKYWNDWREGLNDAKIILHDSIMTQREYKEFSPICEACGVFVGNGTGELAHIKGFGMGGDRTQEPARNYTSNWLHLCHHCHIDVWHGKGIKVFLSQYKNLTYKVNSALKRDYAPVKE